MRSRFHDDVNSGESPLTPVARFGRERGATGSRMRMGIVMTSLVVAGVRCENRKLPNEGLKHSHTTSILEVNGR